MKKLFLLILILASNLFAQEWNPIVTTTINEPEKYDIFPNSSGIHALTRTGSGVIIYYNLNSEGNVYTAKTCTLETSNGDFPNIIGTNDKIYAIYKTGIYIKGKYSADDGISWSNLPIITTTANYCNGVDAVYNDQGVHLVWATQDGGTSGFETYYYRLNLQHTWVDGQNITNDSQAQFGGNPCVTVSPNRVHISVNTDATSTINGTGDAKTRDKLNGVWQTPQTVVSDLEQSVEERLIVIGDYLYLFYNCSNSYDLKYKTRPLTSSSWSNYPPIESGLFWCYEDAFEITKTTNDNIQVIYKKNVDGSGWVFAYTYYNGTNWSTPDIFDDKANVRPIGLSSVSNDLFCTWVKAGTPYLRFRQYDATPLAPSNYAVSVYQSGTNYYPSLTWSLNNEPDVRNKTSNAYQIERRTRPVLIGTWSSWTTLANLSGTTASYIDYSINNATGGDREAEYRITAIDIGNNSSPAQSVTIEYGMYIQDKIKVSGMVRDYLLNQNYPNPFNPSTKISYSIKEEGLVTLKVYDVLGKEIATLVNENKPAGDYEAEFNASSIPSGMYIYKIQSAQFSDVKKMILTK